MTSLERMSCLVDHDM